MASSTSSQSRKRKLDEGLSLKDNLKKVRKFLEDNGQFQMALWVMDVRDLL